ncbi:hypothetical protein JR536_002997 [Listeria monocytogenes]|uniref:hypothetical protein n=1 Tax=Listeria monocytogenes TaxID=1639 RepID=UPI00083E3A07|nr:hypothetical protein [Listeria monocytogenes]EAC2557513.1 hypothetical protein [Listeria monocytogenes]EAC4520839.1 hypothetical protein [Listeria monocytogenes]EAE3700731.1 hypothetical protein [Listeria monocytogenes]EAE8113416.1 hypothetical protein [Listeria monocytogenes]EAE8116648.1 hypothetical protein [Listeria monocytogenes]
MRVKLSRKAYRKAMREMKLRVPYNREIQNKWKESQSIELICKDDGAITNKAIKHYETMPNFILFELK